MQQWERTVVSQYGQSSTLLRLIENFNAYIDPTDNINDFYNFVFNVATAKGYGLDCWGRIVGVSRVLQIASVEYFGFQGPTGASGVPWNQGIFYHGESLTSNFALSDDAFRILIYAKALKNISNATIGSINQIMMTIWGPGGLLPIAGNHYCTDGLDMTMTYTFGGELDPVSSAIVYQSGVLPRPAGVLATVVAPSASFFNNGGELTLLAVSGYPTSPVGLPAGAVWSNSLVVSVVPGIVPNPFATPVFFGGITAADLLVLGGGDLPLTDPHQVGQLWNNGGVIAISFG